MEYLRKNNWLQQRVYSRLPICSFTLKAVIPKKHQPVFIPTTLGEHIRKVRIKRKQTQGQIAKLLHINQMNLSAWELNQKTPHPKYIEIIIDFLGYIPTITSKVERLGTRIKLYRLKHKLSINEFCELKEIEKTLVYKHEMQRFCKFSEKEHAIIEQAL